MEGVSGSVGSRMQEPFRELARKMRFISIPAVSVLCASFLSRVLSIKKQVSLSRMRTDRVREESRGFLGIPTLRFVRLATDFKALKVASPSGFCGVRFSGRYVS